MTEQTPSKLPIEPEVRFVAHGREPFALGILCVLSTIGALAAVTTGRTTVADTLGYLAMGSVVGFFGVVRAVKRSREIPPGEEHPDNQFAEVLNNGLVALSGILAIDVIANFLFDLDRFFMFGVTAAASGILAGAGYLNRRSAVSTPV